MKLIKILILCGFCTLCFYNVISYAGLKQYSEIFATVFQQDFYVKSHNPIKYEIIDHFNDNIARPLAILCIDNETGKPVALNWEIYINNILSYTITNRSKLLTTDYFPSKDDDKNIVIIPHFPDSDEGHFYGIIVTPIIGDN